tara:strand:- start:1528 stop:2574 length:1047 start_codon:yes stop_codon:yes gene_type:complete
MAELSNVEPVDSKFFSNILADEGLSLSAKRRLVDTAYQDRMGLERARSTIERNRQQEQLNRLRLEQDRFNIQEAREKSQKKRAQAINDAKVNEAIRGITTNYGMSPQRKRAELYQLGIDFPESFNNPVVRGQQQAAFNQLNLLNPTVTPEQARAQRSEQRAELKFRQEMQDRREEDFEDIWGPAKGDLEDLKKLLGGSGRYLTPSQQNDLLGDSDYAQKVGKDGKGVDRTKEEKDKWLKDRGYDTYANPAIKSQIIAHLKGDKAFGAAIKIMDQADLAQPNSDELWEARLQAMGYDELQRTANSILELKEGALERRIAESRQKAGLSPRAQFTGSGSAEDNPQGIPDE